MALVHPLLRIFYYRRYYDHDITKARNVMVSDIGLLAKQEQTDEVVVAVTDLRSAMPMPGIEVSILDYQNREIIRGRTSSDGLVRLETLDRQPYLIMAKNGTQRGYLKLDSGTSQSVSHFDVGGTTVRDGIKGFIYGERGVWRPGDPLYVTFILMDTENLLPDSHPVIFEFRNPRSQLIKTVRKTQGVNGFYHVKLDTEPDAPTGNWSARVKVGGVTFNKTLKVATVMPNRLKIGLDFGEGVDVLAGSAIEGMLSARWLHGAVARNLKADVEVSLTRSRTKFDNYENYIFDDPATGYKPETKTIYEGALDNRGVAMVSTDLWAKTTAPRVIFIR